MQAEQVLQHQVIGSNLHAGQDTSVTCQELIEQHFLLLLPAAVWDHEPSRTQQRLRIGFGRTSMQVALEQLGLYLSKRGL